MNFTTVIGLEIHAELLTKSKLFCACENAFGGEPNTRCCPVCLGFPGTLPTLNQEAVTKAVTAGFCLDSEICQTSAFDRKNYFYPDLPKAYQITQWYSPICVGGHVGKIRINNIHIEEDAGKLIHDGDSSLIDLNRCGVPLIEIVTEPDFRNVDEVLAFLSDLSRRLRYAGVSDCRMEQGSLRVDVNISLMPPDSPKLGVRAEIKNLNSFRSIRRAIEFEIKRQSEILSLGGKVVQETRRYDEQKGITVLMRTKEEATDYRYFPEPDLPPVFIDSDKLLAIKSEMPVMPHLRFLKYTEEFSLPVQDAELLCDDLAFSDFFEECVKIINNPSEIAKLMLGELSHRLNYSSKTIADVPFSPNDFSELIKLETENVINKAEQKEILKIMFSAGEHPEDILKRIKKEISEEKIRAKILSLIEENKKLVLEFSEGNDKCVNFFIGQVIRTFGKSVNPNVCREMIIEILSTI